VNCKNTLFNPVVLCDRTPNPPTNPSAPLVNDSKPAPAAPKTFLNTTTDLLVSWFLL